MNKTFKVVFNKARGALMVVNEATSSIQGKGTKTAVAVAAATMIAGVAGTAMAGGTEGPDPVSAYAVKSAVVVNDGKFIGNLTGDQGKIDFENGAVIAEITGVTDMFYGAFSNMYQTLPENGADVLTGAVTIDQSKFEGNTSTNAGGAVTLWQLANDEQNSFDHVISNTTFTNNSAVNNGGALALFPQNVGNILGRTTLNNVTFSGNKQTNNVADFYGYIGGGAVFVESTVLNDNGGDYKENKASDAGVGGAVAFYNAAGKFTGSKFTGNSALLGGAVSLVHSNVEVKDTVFERNQALEGAAIYVSENSTLVVVNSTLANNSASDLGGAIYVEPSKATITDSTFRDNSSGYLGGAIFNLGNLTISGTTTFQGNTAKKGGAVCTAANKLVFDATDAEDVISFVENKADSGSDLYISKSSMVGESGFETPVVELTGKGTITFGGSIAGVEDATITTDAAHVSVADASKFLGMFTVTGGETTVTAEKFFGGNVKVTGAGLLTTNKAAANAYIAQLDDEEPSAVLYVDRAMKLADGAQVVIGNVNSQQIALLTEGDAAPAATASVEVHEGGYALVDVTNFIGSEETVFGDNAKVTVENNAALDLINVAKTGEVKLGASVSVVEGGEIDTDSLYLDATPGENGTVAINYRDGVVADKTVDARLKSLFTKGASAKELAILNGLDNDAYLNTETDTFNALGNKAFEQATGGNATAGVLNVAYDANAQVTDAIVRHQLSEHAGMGVWADVFYAKNEAKKLYGDFGYSADIYGGVLGFDYTAACGGTLGAALTVGTADADSEGGALSNSLSSDFVGLSVYASKDFSGLNVKADLGYIDFSNDFTGIGDASDATTITFGVRGDFTAYQNGAFSVVPHMGLRYTRIDTDAVAFNEEQNMNVLEAPIGVKFAGTFEATGWKLVPSYDFTIVPQLGDKEVEAFGTAGDITILSGGLFNNVLGVEAVKDNMSFGLNASYGFGPDDRANTQINANFRYNF